MCASPSEAGEDHGSMGRFGEGIRGGGGERRAYVDNCWTSGASAATATTTATATATATAPATATATE